jgi:type II secretory ATPase GspE/PulE/Tfp pilus assembly ATPase PilB-like protein/FixJ family two-component response regulator
MSRYSELFKSRGRGESADAEVEEPADEGSPREEEGFTLLFVDDEESVLSALQRIFIEENYRILTATSADKALAIMNSERVHLVISDHRMPGVTGAELLKEIKLRWPQTIRIMLTGYADVQSIMGAVKDGAVYKFITKPWNDEDLRLTVSLALQQYVLMQENQRLKEITRKQQLKIKNYAGLFDENRGMLGTILVNAGMLKKEELERAQREAAEGELLGETLMRLGFITESKIIKALQDHLNIEYVDLKELVIAPLAARFLPRDLCERNRMLPVKLDGKHLVLAMADPSDIYKCDNIALMTGLKVTPMIAAGTEILAQLKNIYGEKGEPEAPFCELDDIEPLDEIDIVIEEEEKEVNIQELVGSSEVPPIIRIVNAIISEAIRLRASDIHIEPKLKYSVVRFRIDGMLQSKIKIPADLHPATISRIKILAKMDISERRRPQDGRITVKAGTKIVDMRVSSMPTLNGEKMVLRILDKSASIKGLPELGVLPDDLKKITTMVKKPQGVIISTGPTGSGKTTMLYSILAAMMEGSKNFETIEEPVEYFLEEANQVSVRDKIGLSFAQVLRATLRQDPDVILVGEIRDFETADVAFKASLTGHMVLSTLHTNSSVASITRLMDMGIKPYIIGSALEGVMAQRLVRRICRHCLTMEAPDGETLELLRIPAETFTEGVPRGKGCERCNRTGFAGRTGVFELFVMTDDFRHFISTSYKESELVEMARANGMRTLIEDGIEKVKRGETSLDELLRVIGPQIGYERACPTCDRLVDAKFLFCPFCGAFRQDFCRECRVPLEQEWLSCPFCGRAKQSLA